MFFVLMKNKRVRCADGRVCEERRDAEDKMAESRAAHARAAVARASAHVSRAEERVAILDREASQAALEATHAAERAKVAEQLAAELREQERKAQEELIEKEKIERELIRKQREEQKRLEEQWERHTAQLKKRASTVDEKVLDTWLSFTYVTAHCIHQSQATTGWFLTVAVSDSNLFLIDNTELMLFFTVVNVDTLVFI